MMSKCAVSVLLLVHVFLTPSVSGLNKDIQITNGVYDNLVIGLSMDVQESTDIGAIVDNIKNFIKVGSSSLHNALNEKASIGSVSLVIPRSVNSSVLADLTESNAKLSIESADILFYVDADAIPNTLQIEGCGIPGTQIQVPIHFASLNDEERAQYGSEGMIMAHEWAHYRYGVQDEHGFHNDEVYLNYHGTGNDIEHVGCFQSTPTGFWKRSCDSDATCSPLQTNQGCNFCTDADNHPSVVKASLGYMPALSEGQFCTAQTHVKGTTTPQNILCKERSVMEVIEAHPDYESMTIHTLSDPIVTLIKEPLPRVLLLLDTPPDDSSPVVDYKNLLSDLQVPLTKYSDLQISIMTYKVVNEEVQLVNDRPFDTVVGDEGYEELYSFLPDATSRTSVPALSEVFVKLLEEIDDYQPGTMVIMPLSNDLIPEGDLTKEIGFSLHEKNMKPLVVFPEKTVNFQNCGSFLQYSGSRMINSNGTDAYIYLKAASEVNYFVDNTYKHDHYIMNHDTFTLASEETNEKVLFYSGLTVQERIMVVSVDDTSNIGDVQLFIRQFGLFVNCSDLDLCVYTENSIYFSESSSVPVGVEDEWEMQVYNNGTRSANIDVVWSKVTFTGATPEIDVSVWLSDGRGPIAALGEANNAVKLYASISYSGQQVLKSRVEVSAEVTVTLPEGSTRDLTVNLMDNSEGGDIRTDDSVYTYAFTPENSVVGTQIRVKTVTINDIGRPYRSSEKQYDSSVASNSQTRSKVRQPGQGLYTMDPFESECCGSVIDDPDVSNIHILLGFSYVKYGEPESNLPSITITREVGFVPTTLKPTTAPPTTTPTTTTPTTTTPTTTTPTTTTPTTTTTTPPTADPTEPPNTSDDPTTSTTPEGHNTPQGPSTPEGPSTSQRTITPEQSTTTLNPTISTDEPTVLSDGAVAAIVLSSVAVVGVVAFGMYFMYSNKMFCFAKGVLNV